MKVANKIVVVTGGLSGLGDATVQAMHALGAFIAVVDLQLPKAKPGSQSLRYFAADVSNPQEVEEATQKILEWGEQEQLDIAAVVNCAGFLGSSKILSKNGAMALDRLKKVIDISLIGTLDITRQLLPRMSTQTPDEDGERGVIITVASAAAFDGQEGQVAYSAAKGGIAAMTLPLARDLSRHGVRVVCIAPGMFGTSMVSGMPDRVKESLDKSLEFPSRAGYPEEFAGLVQHVFENKMLNGTVLRLDGGARMPARL